MGGGTRTIRGHSSPLALQGRLVLLCDGVCCEGCAVRGVL